MYNYTKEQLEYLRKTQPISPIINSKLKKAKSVIKNLGLNDSTLENKYLEDYEFNLRIANYERGWHKFWKNSNWGNGENESLRDFAIGCLKSETNEKNNKTR